METLSRGDRAALAVPIAIPFLLALTSVVLILWSDDTWIPKWISIPTILSPFLVVPVGAVMSRRIRGSAERWKYIGVLFLVAAVMFGVAYAVIIRLVAIYCDGRYECPW